MKEVYFNVSYLFSLIKSSPFKLASTVTANKYGTLWKGKEAWRRSCDAGSHTRGCEFEPNAGHSYAFSFISAAFRAVSRALMVLNHSHWVMLGSGTGVGN